MSKPLKIAVVGAAGRMGKTILECIDNDGTFEASAAVVNPDETGKPIGPQKIQTSKSFQDAAERSDVFIDFSSPEGALETSRASVETNTPVVTGTTGLDDEQLKSLREASEAIPLLKAANFSVGINLLNKLVEMTSEATAGGFDIEIFEAHHNQKTDAPSGTALQLGRSAAEARNLELDEEAVWGRHGEVGKRGDSDIGFQVLRGGDIKGEHTVYFCGDDERIELTHRAGSRNIFAQGALKAAKWITHQPPSFYNMSDLLFGQEQLSR